MMNKYDFVFLYEIKNRELESVLLLKYELMKKGFSVCIIETWENEVRRRKPVYAEVLVTFALYNDETVNYALSFVKGCDKIINLQWEQVFTNGDAFRIKNKADISNMIKGEARKGRHISWGMNNYRRLIDYFDVPKKNVCIAGNVSLDFLRPELRKYYYSRYRILKKYGIDDKKKVYLFISSFSYVDMPNRLLQSDLYKDVGFDLNLFRDISCTTQVKLLDWFRVELTKHPEIELIYRPHPAEAGNGYLRKMSIEFANFHVISDYSIKQWILIVDKVYSWWSTSVAEVYAAGKGCSILRPVEIPYDSDLEIYKNCEKLTTFEQFDKDYLSYNEFPIPKKDIEKYYCFDLKEPSYVKIVNCMLNTYYDKNKDGFSYRRNYSSRFVIMQQNFKNLLKNYFINHENAYHVFRFVIDFLKISDRELLDQKMEEYKYTRKMCKKNHYNFQEACVILNRIKNTIE